MKKVFILATAAIVALASCAKTQVVYNDQPEEIAFKQITGAMTKANLSATTTMGVIAHRSDSDPYALYFGNTKFVVKDVDANTWGAESSKYWPYDATDKLDFTVYAPYGTASLENDVLTVTGITAAEDILYGAERYKSKGKNEGNVPVVLKHACAKISVEFKGTGVFTVKNLTLANAPTEGNYIVDYTSMTVNVTSEPSKQDNYTFTGVPNNSLSDVAVKCTDELFVLPGDQTSFKIIFEQANDGAAIEYTRDIDLSTAEWEANNHYTYTITITAEEIILQPTVTEWDPVSVPLDNADLI